MRSDPKRPRLRELVYPADGSLIYIKRFQTGGYNGQRRKGVILAERGPRTIYAILPMREFLETFRWDEDRCLGGAWVDKNGLKGYNTPTTGGSLDTDPERI